MKRKKNKDRNQQTSKNDESQPPLDQKFTEKNGCDEIDPEHCEELHRRHFTNDPTQVFHEVRTLELRYQYSIAELKTRIDDKIKKSQRDNGERYRHEIENRKKELDSLVQALEREINKNILALNSQEMYILTQIETMFQEKSKELVNQMIVQMGLNF